MAIHRLPRPSMCRARTRLSAKPSTVVNRASTVPSRTRNRPLLVPIQRSPAGSTHIARTAVASRSARRGQRLQFAVAPAQQPGVCSGQERLVIVAGTEAKDEIVVGPAGGRRRRVVGDLARRGVQQAQAVVCADPEPLPMILEDRYDVIVGESLGSCRSSRSVCPGEPANPCPWRSRDRPPDPHTDELT